MALNFTKEEKIELKNEFKKQDELYDKYKEFGMTIDEARNIVEGQVSLSEVLQRKNPVGLLFKKVDNCVTGINQSHKKTEKEEYILELVSCIEEFIDTCNEGKYYHVFWNRLIELGLPNMTSYKNLKIALIKFRKKQMQFLKELSNEELNKDFEKINYDYIPIRYEGAFAAQKYRAYIRYNKDFQSYCHAIAHELKKYKINELTDLAFLLYEVHDCSNRFPRLVPYFQAFYENKYDINDVTNIIYNAYIKYHELKSIKEFNHIIYKYVLSSNYYLYKRVLKVKVFINKDLKIEIIYNDEPYLEINYNDKLYKVAFDLFERRLQKDSFTKLLLKKVEEYLIKNNIEKC